MPRRTLAAKDPSLTLDDDRPPGWYLLGPMVTVCSRDTCAPTHDQAMKIVEGALRAWPITRTELEQMKPPAKCINCGLPLLSDD